jgi:bacteriocin biosynthesis cyclodehydratase domain-containing protein
MATVLGDTHLAEALRRALPPGGEGMVVCGWPDVGRLLAFGRAADRPWLLVEDGGPDAVAVGPLFAPGRPGCLDCFVRRRASSGAEELLPPRPVAIEAGAIGREAARLMAPRAPGTLARQVVVGRDGSRAEHLFLPVPGCPRCDPHPPTPAQAPPEAAVSDRLGIVREVTVDEAALPGFFVARAQGADTTQYRPIALFNHGIALDETRARATARAVGEALERYGCGFPAGLLEAGEADPALPRLTPAELGAAGVPPDAPGLRWVAARSLADGSPVLVPAGAVFLPHPRAPGEPSLGVQSSTGLGAGRSLDEAAEHALHELWERDAFMRAWRFGLPVGPVRAPVPALEGLHLARVPCAAGIPVVVALIERPSPPFAAAGLAARPDLDSAARAAALEAAAALAWVRERLDRDGPPPPGPPRTLYDHAVVHAVDPALAPSRRRFLRPDGPEDRARAPGGWRDLAARTPGACMVELTPPDLAAVGMHVVRVMAPGFVPLDHDATAPRLPGDPTPHFFA